MHFLQLRKRLIKMYFQGQHAVLLRSLQRRKGLGVKIKSQKPWSLTHFPSQTDTLVSRLLPHSSPMVHLVSLIQLFPPLQFVSISTTMNYTSCKHHFPHDTLLLPSTSASRLYLTTTLCMDFRGKVSYEGSWGLKGTTERFCTHLFHLILVKSWEMFTHSYSVTSLGLSPTELATNTQCL